MHVQGWSIKPQAQAPAQWKDSEIEGKLLFVTSMSNLYYLRKTHHAPFARRLHQLRMMDNLRKTCLRSVSTSIKTTSRECSFSLDPRSTRSLSMRHVLKMLHRLMPLRQMETQMIMSDLLGLVSTKKLIEHGHSSGYSKYS